MLNYAWFLYFITLQGVLFASDDLLLNVALRPINHHQHANSFRQYLYLSCANASYLIFDAYILIPVVYQIHEFFGNKSILLQTKS